MPTYEYNCPQCGDIEIFHSIMEDARKVCPQCGDNGLKRIISAGVGFIFKGREINQYNDVKCAKFWRDSNGIRHRVKPGDGNLKSVTIDNKRRASQEEFDARVKRDRRKDQIRKRLAGDAFA